MKQSISIIVPVYNVHIQTIQFIIDKYINNPKCKIIIVFDGQQDNMSKILVDESKREQCKVISIPHGGVSAARNEGLKHADTEWVTFLDADDDLDDAVLLEMVKFAEKNTCDVVQGGYKTVMRHSVEHHGKEGSPRVISDTDDRFAFLGSILSPDQGTANVWGKIYRTALIRENDLLFDTSLSLGEDTVFVFDTISRSSRIGVYPEELYAYQRNGESTVTSFRRDYEEDILRFLSVIEQRVLSTNNQKISEYFDSCVVFHEIMIIVHYIFNPNSDLTKKERKDAFSGLIRQDIFHKSIINVKLNTLSVSKRIFAMAIRLHWFWLCEQMCNVRNRQIG